MKHELRKNEMDCTIALQGLWCKDVYTKRAPNVLWDNTTNYRIERLLIEKYIYNRTLSMRVENQLYSWFEWYLLKCIPIKLIGNTIPYAGIVNREDLAELWQYRRYFLIHQITELVRKGKPLKYITYVIRVSFCLREALTEIAFYTGRTDYSSKVAQFWIDYKKFCRESGNWFIPLSDSENEQELAEELLTAVYPNAKKHSNKRHTAKQILSIIDCVKSFDFSVELQGYHDHGKNNNQ